MASTSSYFSTSSRSSKTAALSSLRSLSNQMRRKRTVEIKYEEENKVANTSKDEIVQQSPDKNNLVDKAKSKKVKVDCKWHPENWEMILDNIKEMRLDRTAVVDTLGCERTADVQETPQVIRYQTLVSLMLSSQTKDQVTFAAMTNLKKHGLTIPNILKTSEVKIGELIYPVGFFKRKAKHILKASHICHERFNDDIPDSIEGLISLPGVGPKMAYICMNAAWGKVEGIGVDTHVHRIANRLRWVRKPTKDPEKTRESLEAWLPRSEWKDLNILLVGFGQQTCLPVGPKCGICLNRNICPASTATDKKE